MWNCVVNSESQLSVLLDTGTRVIPLVMQASAPSVIERPEVELPGDLVGTSGYVVTVFDNDYNTYEQVMMILMAATGCTLREAEIETWEIDHLGRSVVHHASEKECKRVAEVISTIGIRVSVTEE